MPSKLSYPLSPRQPWVDNQGLITRPWQQWLLELWRRTGGGDTLTNDEIALALQAEFLVAAPNAALGHERTVANSPTVIWDFSTSGQATASVDPEGLQDVLGALLQSSPTITVVYDDAANALTLTHNAVSRVVPAGTVRTVQSTYAIVAPRYFRVQGTLILQGDAAVEIL